MTIGTRGVDENGSSHGNGIPTVIELLDLNKDGNGIPTGVGIPINQSIGTCR